jgi:hypothetical protein
VGSIAFALLALTSGLCGGEQPGKPDFVLRDYLGREWRNESVGFELAAEQLEKARAGKALMGPEGESLAYQMVTVPGAARRIEFMVDLGPFEELSYRFGDGRAERATDLRVERTGETVRLVNALTGIAIRTQPAGGKGPVEALRLQSGTWMGGSMLSDGVQVLESDVEVTARGPVFAEVVCRLKLGGGGNWEGRFRLEAREPVVLVEETITDARQGGIDVLLGRGLAPDRLFSRYGKGVPGDANRVGTPAKWKITSDLEQPVFVWTPWLRWWERVREYTWFGLYRAAGPDMLAVGALRPGVWITPEQRKNGRRMPRIQVRGTGDDLRMRLPLESGKRSWMLAALPRERSLEVLAEKRPDRAPLPQQYLIKHGDFPLDRVKDYVLEWEAEEEQHPRLFLDREWVAEFRADFQADQAELERFRHRPVRRYTMGGPLRYWFGTGDPQLGRHLTETAVEWVQGAVNMYLHQGHLITLGFAPHHQTSVLTSLNLTDAILASEHLTPELRRRLLAQIAFLGYTVDRDDYWDPRRGYAANPNMTSTVAAYQAVTAGIIPAHPRAGRWMGHAMDELKDKELDTWSDANGGWLEAPHYAMVSYDYMLGCFLMAHNAGFNEYLYHPRMKKVIAWFAKTSTPPDSRLKGWRHKPPIGNTYFFEPCGEFALVAALWKDRDPEFAARMQWMFEQHGSYPHPGIGGFYPTLAGYRSLLQEHADVQPKAPEYGSELFPRTGVVLRTGFPGERETMLHMIAGSNHAHYDRDSGSIYLWGKGRILADDFGYTGHGPGEDHSMVVGQRSPAGAVMAVKDFAAQDRFDYVHGVKRGWTRQLAFVKSPDAAGPNYFVVRDSLDKPADATWRLWLNVDEVQIGGRLARVVGKEDVDMAVFFGWPDEPALTTEQKTRESHALRPDGRQGRMERTQIGLIGDMSGTTSMAVVLYPHRKNQQPPEFESLEGGRVVKIHTERGTDYVFLADSVFTFADDVVQFEGTVGALQDRNDGVALSLGAAGTISAGGMKLDAQKAANKVLDSEN